MSRIWTCLVVIGLLVAVAPAAAASNDGTAASAGSGDGLTPSTHGGGGEVSAAEVVSRWFFSNRLRGGSADFVIDFGPGFGDDFFVGDWDGDGVDDIGRRESGTNHFVLLDIDKLNGAATRNISYGKPGDEVFVGDWDGNGTDTFAVRRGNVFFLRNHLRSGRADVVLGYGRPGDEVFVGDWDGNGTDTFAVRRGNIFYVRNRLTSGKADVVLGYGRPGDEVLVGDWNGSGNDTFAVRRGRVFYVRNTVTTGRADIVFTYGLETDEVFVGDWNGSGNDTFAVRRAADNADELLAEGAVLKLTDLEPGWRRSSFGEGEHPNTTACAAVREANRTPVTGYGARAYDRAGGDFVGSEVAVFATVAQARDYLSAWKNRRTVRCVRQGIEAAIAADPEISGSVTAARSSPVPIGDDRTAIQAVANLVIDGFAYQVFFDLNITRVGRAIAITQANATFFPLFDQRRFIEPVVNRLVAGLSP